MRRTRWAAGLVTGLVAALAVPGAALADSKTLQNVVDGKFPADVAINSVWVLVAGILVMFMQAGFAFLEIGFSRGKNAGTIVAKILVNFAIAGLMFYAVGFAFAFGDGGSLIGTHGSALSIIQNDSTDGVTLNGPISHFFYGATELFEGTVFTATSVGNTQQFKLTYAGGDGNDVVLMATPEPGTFTCLLGGLAALAGARKRRRK